MKKKMKKKSFLNIINKKTKSRRRASKNEKKKLDVFEFKDILNSHYSNLHIIQKNENRNNNSVFMNLNFDLKDQTRNRNNPKKSNHQTIYKNKYYYPLTEKADLNNLKEVGIIKKSEKCRKSIIRNTNIPEHLFLQNLLKRSVVMNKKSFKKIRNKKSLNQSKIVRKYSKEARKIKKSNFFSIQKYHDMVKQRNSCTKVNMNLINDNKFIKYKKKYFKYLDYTHQKTKQKIHPKKNNSKITALSKEFYIKENGIP
jgi:hypothetical protein